LRIGFSSSENAADPDRILARLRRLDACALQIVLGDWQIWAREDQLGPPETADGRPWRTWLLLGGRGAGKTRAGAEWVKAQALGHDPLVSEPAMRIALVGETIKDVLAVMVEGISGLLAVHRTADRPVLLASRHQLVWPNGAIAQMFSAEDPDGLRGPQFHAAWCDEVCKWRYADRTWDMLQFALRLGPAPRQVVTTTPRPIPLLKRIMDDAGTVIDRVASEENKEFLAPPFLSDLRRRYAGTALGRQELDGELIEDCAAALWRQDWIDELRVGSAPELTRIVVAVDPPVTATASSDACGLIVAGLGVDRRGYVLADRTLQGREPAAWARAAVAAYRDFAADRIVAEANQGGDLVESVIRQVDGSVPIGLVRATRGKWLRAEPVAALYAEARVAHVGHWPELETQMLAFGADGLVAGKSPDRLDALVWALTELMLDPRPEPAIRMM
jgi:phage terminase large subunit-like protein